MRIHIGFDDTDSTLSGCTTHLAKEFVRHLGGESELRDYPNLVRLNPNIPWKTRGNAALALRLEVDDPDGVFQDLCNILHQSVDADGGACHPGMVMLVSEEVPEEIESFYRAALSAVVSVKKALDVIFRFRMKHYGEGRMMGLVGAVAAIGGLRRGDYTYELLAYRRRENWGTPRRLDPSSVEAMSAKTYPGTYNNYDPATGRILIAPRGPDPVLLGIRGEEPEVLLEAYAGLRIEEPVDSYMIFRSNQGTGVHLIPRLSLSPPKAYGAGHVTGQISLKPSVQRGGHVFFKIRDGAAEAWCAVYEPAGPLRMVTLHLRSGDVIQVGGGVRKRTSRHPPVLNVEYLSILSLAPQIRYVSPPCPRCPGRMTSMGAGQGRRCGKCGFRDPKAGRMAITATRSLAPGLYLPPPRAQRHLSKPLQRYGMEKERWNGKLIESWSSFDPSVPIRVSVPGG